LELYSLSQRFACYLTEGDVCDLIRLSTAPRIASVSFTSLLARCMGKRLGAFFLRTALFVR
jgi:hypothetical protein